VPEPFDPQSLNRYSYVMNNPTNRIDPSGNWSFDLGLGFGLLSYSTGIGFDWDWGWALGASASTGSYGIGYGFSGLLGWDSGGFASDFSAWADSTYFGFGRSSGESYMTSPFGSSGGDTALGQRALRAEVGLAGLLGTYDKARDATAVSRVASDPNLTGAYASYEPKLDGTFAVATDFSTLGFGEGRSVMGHEYWHSVDMSNESVQSTLYDLEVLHPEPITIWNSTFTSSTERGFANTALELRATVYESGTSRYRGARSELHADHYLEQYGRPIDALGLQGFVLGLEPRLP
jgi:hypothetical protein